MSGLGTIAGALGPIALGIGAIASIVSSLDDSGTYHTGGAARYSAATGLRTSLGFRDNEEGLPPPGAQCRGSQVTEAQAAGLVGGALGCGGPGVAVDHVAGRPAGHGHQPTLGALRR